MAKREKRGLGRGLSALMADIETGADEAGSAPAPAADRTVPVEMLHHNPEQPRRSFSSDALNELAASISEKGIIQPLIVRPHPGIAGEFQIVAGERRWRAAQRAQLHEVPVIVRDFDDTEVLEVAIIENIQRADLNPIEEAAGYRQLMDRFGHTQEKLAEAMGKSRSHVANALRLLNLPEDIQQMVREGKLSAGHARALVTAENPSDLARKIIARGLSVREAEKLAKKPDSGSIPKARPRPVKDADTLALEGDLSAATGRKVTIDHDAASGSGQVSIHYEDLAALDDIVRVLNRT